MKSFWSIALHFLLLASLSSCQNSDPAPTPKQEPELQPGTTETYQVNLQEITKDWRTWYNYTYHQVRLAQDFKGYDLDSTLMDKPAFLKKLSLGRCIAVKVAQDKNAPVYRLMEVKEMSDDMRNTTMQMAKSAIELMKMEGKPLPAFNFTDVEGRTYDSQNTKGKLLVVKCWFINCVACVKEFPVLNDLVDKYKDRQDVQFISLASDAKQDLLTFLSKKEFRYAVVPAAEAYMSNGLAVTAYPTHLLVDKNGIIRKVTNSIDDLLPSLEKEIK
jgi:thiol-disulfide isomerase/thioredoxin